MRIFCIQGDLGTLQSSTGWTPGTIFSVKTKLLLCSGNTEMECECQEGPAAWFLCWAFSLPGPLKSRTHSSPAAQPTEADTTMDVSRTRGLDKAQPYAYFNGRVKETSFQSLLGIRRLMQGFSFLLSIASFSLTAGVTLWQDLCSGCVLCWG